MKMATIPAVSLREGQQRLKPNFYLNAGKLRLDQMRHNGHPMSTIGEQSAAVYRSGIFKRQFVRDPQFGLPYISGADMMKSAPLESSRLVSAKYTPNTAETSLKTNQILITCAGSVGNVRLITADLEGVIGSQDIIRVDYDEQKFPYGFLYAYLSSPTVYDYMQSLYYGSVIPRIEPFHVRQIPVPRLPAAQMQRIHVDIEQAARLREKATEALSNAVELLENLLPQLVFTNHYVTPVSAFKQRLRIDATIQQAAYGRYLEEAAKSATLKKIASVSAQVFTPGIFKRIRVAAKNGVVFLSGTNLLENRPALTSFLSRRTHRLDDYILKEGWLAIQDSGSLSSMGYVSIVPEFLANAAATNNLVRVIPGEMNYNPYFFAYLKTKQGQQILKSLSYGTGQLHIDHGQIAQLEVPVYQDVFNKVTELISNYTSQFNEAYKLETQAIHTVETAISAWQK
jgi:type I restriction enzyme S subunit